jgi:hypothetical protein
MATQVTLNDGSIDSAGSLALKTNGTTTAVTVDTSQNVGIGTASPSDKLVVSATSAGSVVTLARLLNAGTTTGTASRLLFTNNTDGSGGAVSAAISHIAENTSGAGSLAFYTPTTGSPVERLRITSAGNVGIGTSSPSEKITVKGGVAVKGAYSGTSNGGAVNITYNTGTSTGSIYALDPTVAWKTLDISSLTTTFGISGTERARIDSSGNLLVGTTSAGIGAGIGTTIEASGLNNARITVNHSSGGSSNGSYFMQFAYGGTLTGSISQASVTSVAFNTTSDKRLKTDNGLAVDTSVIDNSEVHDFTWTSSGDADRGVFAQDAILVKPSAVTVGSDEVNEDGNIITPWSVDYSKYVPDLIVHAQQLKKQVQEQQALITTLTDRITALEAK